MPQLKRSSSKNNVAVAAPLAPQTSTAARVRDAAAAGLLAALGILVYSNSFTAPFVLDGEIIRNTLSWETLWPWQFNYGDNRPLGMLTFSLNYAWGEDRVEGYHAVNLAIHVIAGLLLYGIVRRTLARPPLAGQFGAASRELAFAVAAVWLVHPLETESVTYIYQRLEALMGLFYLSTLYCFIRAQASDRPALWYALSVMACVLGTATKEAMVTALVVVLWYDRALVAQSWREIVRRRWQYYAALAGTWAELAFLMTRPTARYETSGLLIVNGLTPWDYALSQPGVIVHYLKLCFWPSNLCLDYAWPVAKDWMSIVPPGLAIAALLSATVWCIFRRPALGFLGGAFFLILAPTSSVAPIRDLAFEHRMYLPLAGVVALVVLAAYRAWLWLFGRPNRGGRKSATLPRPLLASVLVLTVIGALGGRTWLRNKDYESLWAIWQDVLLTSPDNVRALEKLVQILDTDRQYAAALKLQDHVLELKPQDAKANYDRGILRESLGKLNEALPDLTRAIRLKPDFRDAYLDRAGVYFKLNDFEPAIRDLTESIRLETTEPPSEDGQRHLATTYERRGMVYERLGQFRAAKSDYDEACQLDPTNLSALKALAWLLATCPDSALRDGQRAVADANRLCKLTKFRNAENLDTLAAAHAELGDFQKAVQYESGALRLAGDSSLPSQEFLQRLREFKAGKPHREARKPLKQAPPLEK